MAGEYWAFLSYSSQDTAWADWLHRAIEAYAVPRRLVGLPTPAGPAPRNFRPVFKDSAELAADPDLKASISNALDRSAFLIVLCSPAAARSHWVDAEIRRFVALHGIGRVLCVIVGGEPSGAAPDCFPPALQEAGYAEPVAADLRLGRQGRRTALLKLLAGMLGIGLDELVHRDAQRRHRVLLAISAASVVGMAAMGALALAALIARNESQQQHARAEGMVEYMLADLRQRLEPSGRLDLMDAIGRKALAYYATQDARRLDAESLAHRARALQLVGEVSALRGNLDEARRSFEQASVTTGESLARSPNDGGRIFDHAQSVFWVGSIAYQRGDNAKARAQFEQYRILAERLTALDPANDDWQAEVNYAYSNLGAVALDQGRSSDAVNAFQHSLAVTSALAGKHPADLTRQLDLGQSRAWLGDALEQQGRLAQARAQRLAELEAYRRILERDPTVQRAAFSSIVALRKLARLSLFAGDEAGGLGRLRDAASQADALLAGQPDNMDVEGGASIARIELAEALMAAGRLDEARAENRRGAAMIATALSHDSSVLLWRQHRAQAQLVEAALSARRGSKEAALRLDQGALAGLQGAAARDAEGQWLLARARLQDGDDLEALGRAAEARAQWTAVLQSLPPPTQPYAPRLLVLLEAGDQRLARRQDAAVIASRLAGYRAELSKARP